MRIVHVFCYGYNNRNAAFAYSFLHFLSFQQVNNPNGNITETIIA